MKMDDLFKLEQYSIDTPKKHNMLLDMLKDKNDFHSINCAEYGNILRSLDYHKDAVTDIRRLPYIPVSLFKKVELKSVKKEEIFKTLYSSGTSSTGASKIILDRNTASLQTKALASIITSFIGNKRLPMLIADSKNLVSDRTSFNARGAGVLGLANFGKDHTYLLDAEFNPDKKILLEFAEKYRDESVLFFGFTFMIWQYLTELLRKENLNLNMKGYLFHGGGWKKLEALKVNNNEYKRRIRETLGNIKVHNFYGMVEQVGSVYVECEEGHFHTPNYSEIIIRSLKDLSPSAIGEEGVIQTISVLPESYPGNSLLTEDRGRILGVDDCPCGRKGTYFEILGRIPKAELRGCSDVYAN